MVHKTSSYLAIIVSLSLRSRPLSKVVTNNLDVHHLTKEAFTESQNSEKIRRALPHNLRDFSNIKYITSNTV